MMKKIMSKENLIIYVSSRKNYDMLSGEVLKNINTEGFEFINVDDKSSPDRCQPRKQAREGRGSTAKNTGGDAVDYIYETRGAEGAAGNCWGSEHPQTGKPRGISFCRAPRRNNVQPVLRSEDQPPELQPPAYNIWRFLLEKQNQLKSHRPTDA